MFSIDTKRLAAALLVCSCAAMASAEQPLVVPLWPNGAPGFEDRRNEPERTNGGSISNIHNPSITVFLPPAERANGAAVLIFPGGGHRQLVFNAEGVEPAHYWNDLGVAAFVLKYRLPREPNSPYSLKIHLRQDADRAMRLIRSRASEWHIDPNRLGVMGFSAGGEVASMLIYNPTAGDPNAPDPIDRLDAFADFQIVIYPGPLGIPEKIASDAPPAFSLSPATTPITWAPSSRWWRNTIRPSAPWKCISTREAGMASTWADVPSSLPSTPGRNG